jgi:hypothetical protein
VKLLRSRYEVVTKSLRSRYKVLVPIVTGLVVTSPIFNFQSAFPAPFRVNPAKRVLCTEPFLRQKKIGAHDVHNLVRDTI